jgi:hypothetical protein
MINPQQEYQTQNLEWWKQAAASVGGEQGIKTPSPKNWLC